MPNLSKLIRLFAQTQVKLALDKFWSMKFVGATGHSCPQYGRIEGRYPYTLRSFLY
jgi:hypothetical protein